jgi:hypothetical protein
MQGWTQQALQTDTTSSANSIMQTASAAAPAGSTTAEITDQFFRITVAFFEFEITVEFFKLVRATSVEHFNFILETTFEFFVFILTV